MEIVRKPNAPNHYQLWTKHLKKWKLNLSEDEFFWYWFSGEHIMGELLEYVKKLKSKGMKIFLLSNNFKERTKYYKEYFPQIFTVVDEAYFSWETGLVKPDEKAFLKILQENKLQPEQCVYFDGAYFFAR